jgi:mannose-1-phosphate guanylyltransferase
MGVWNLAKNAPKSQVALKALYTIVKSFNPDIKYGYIQEASKRGMADKVLEFLEKFSYMDEDKKVKIAYDPDYGFYQ